jgi:hypothetical protein
MPRSLLHECSTPRALPLPNGRSMPQGATPLFWGHPHSSEVARHPSRLNQHPPVHHPRSPVMTSDSLVDEPQPELISGFTLVTHSIGD